MSRRHISFGLEVTSLQRDGLSALGHLMLQCTNEVFDASANADVQLLLRNKNQLISAESSVDLLDFNHTSMLAGQNSKKPKF
jgi:hypothetical protein